MSTPAVTLRGPTAVHRKAFAPRSRFAPAGVAVMVAFHALVGWALWSGLGQHAIQIVKKPLTATLVEEVKLPPPPPPPPPPKQVVKQEVPKPQAPPPPAFVPPPDVTPPPAANPAPALTAVQSTQPVAPPPAAPPSPPVVEAPKPRPDRLEVGVACPGYQDTLQGSLSSLYERVGVAGTVKVRFVVRHDRVADAQVLSGPRDYQRAVLAAVRRFECRLDGVDEVAVEFDISFRE
ncbi:energy transducer TonB [Aquabacterium sp. J223]|uniref:energy transducer TonB n=1 Tax=Aquabacterium sp. J223 TaxID=2898431 RepID=UPI0021AD52D9|nr:energy transducer TonB [Aquabacterium sp. J223]UUX96401.1 energy transducer TonB [Aquabacterium sp. J223]